MVDVTYWNTTVLFWGGICLPNTRPCADFVKAQCHSKWSKAVCFLRGAMCQQRTLRDWFSSLQFAVCKQMPETRLNLSISHVFSLGIMLLLTCIFSQELRRMFQSTTIAETSFYCPKTCNVFASWDIYAYRPFIFRDWFQFAVNDPYNSCMQVFGGVWTWG